MFDWYGSGDTPSSQFPAFRFSAASAEVFDATAARVGAVIAGRTTYDHSGAGRQTFVATGIADAVAAAREAAGDRDVALMGSGVIRAALDAGLLDEVIIHQVPILLGGGTPLFQPANKPVSLQLRTVVPAPGVTHLHYEIHT